jgi:hypothetical protein
MFCSNCGFKLTEQTKFCSQCGSGILTEQRLGTQPMELNSIQAIPSPYPMDNNPLSGTTTKLRPLHWIMPLVSLILVGSLITGIYFYQQSVNRSVVLLLQVGEKLAIEGNWKEGLVRIESALEKRPEHPVLLKDRSLLIDAMALEARVIDTDKMVEENRFNEALKTIDSLKEELKVRSGPLSEQLVLTTGIQEEHIILAQVTHDFPTMDKINDLMSLLNAIKDYDSVEAKKTDKNIRTKVIDLTHEKASSELKDKNFTVAMTTVDDGLKLDSSSIKLLDLKQMIQTTRKKFEDAEMERIQKAREYATNEDLKNKTAAVELISSNGFYNESTGFFDIEIHLRNVATRPISSIVVYYDLLDNSGDIVGNGTGYVQPDILDINQSGSLYNYHYTDGGLASVNVTNFEWYIN